MIESIDLLPDLFRQPSDAQSQLSLLKKNLIFPNHLINY